MSSPGSVLRVRRLSARGGRAGGGGSKGGSCSIPQEMAVSVGDRQDVGPGEERSAVCHPEQSVTPQRAEAPLPWTHRGGGRIFIRLPFDLLSAFHQTLLIAPGLKPVVVLVKFH